MIHLTITDQLLFLQSLFADLKRNLLFFLPPFFTKLNLSDLSILRQTSLRTSAQCSLSAGCTTTAPLCSATSLLRLPKERCTGMPACQVHCSENCAPCRAHMWPTVSWGAIGWQGSKQPTAWLCLRGSPAWGAAQFGKFWHVPWSQDWKYVGPLQTKDYYFRQCFLPSYQPRKLY